MSFLKDLNDIAGVVTYIPGEIAREIKKGLQGYKDDEEIYPVCGKCGKEYSNRFDNCPKCDEKR